MSFVATKKMSAFDWVIYTFLALISLLCLFPFIYVFSVSFTDPEAYVPLKFYFFQINGLSPRITIYCRQTAFYSR